MDVIALLITNPEAPLLIQPGEDALDHGPMLAQAASMFGVPSRDPEDDSSLPESFADLVLGIVGPVCVQGVGPASPACPRPLDGRNGIDQGHGGFEIVNIRAGMDQRKRDALTVADDMPFQPVFAAIRGIGASFRPPKRARTELLSTTALDQSILSANPNSSRSAYQTFCHTPATGQSRRRRQQVMPLPQPNFGGIFPLPLRFLQPTEFLSGPIGREHGDDRPRDFA